MKEQRIITVQSTKQFKNLFEVGRNNVCKDDSQIHVMSILLIHLEV